MNILLLSMSGGLGAICRYLLGLAIMKKNPYPEIPIAMLTVNVIGSFGLGVFFGAFTTFSTFSMEAVELLREKKYRKALIYISISLIGSVITFSIGYLIGIWMAG
ncbi:CrcB protein [Virgibacillus natechei]|uniref:Fluoride-specific ion channel FluC n=1 Tax=Virgibacillus natechei TaxID=1216297 RepID=A0ABS4IHP0_9BACI|nr:CrcB family protein [Virgibacillus natechei]MBP1970472.1 CrcB protein [Virgibacillus natechei]UZD13879.1 CrcB family protein [Virgibacillus natechei]